MLPIKPVPGPGMSPASMPTSPARASVGAPASTIDAKSTLNPNAKAFVMLNPEAKEFQPSAARPPLGQTSTPSPWPITPATPTGGNLPFQVGQVEYYPTIQAGGFKGHVGIKSFNPYKGTMPNDSSVAPTLQPPPPPHQYQQQPRLRYGTPHASNEGGKVVKKSEKATKKSGKTTMEEKLDIIKESAAGKTNAQIALRKNMDETSVCSILDELQMWYYLDKVQNEIKEAVKKNPPLSKFFVCHRGQYLLRDPSDFPWGSVNHVKNYG